MPCFLIYLSLPFHVHQISRFFFNILSNRAVVIPIDAAVGNLILILPHPYSEDYYSMQSSTLKTDNFDQLGGAFTVVIHVRLHYPVAN